MFSTLLLFSTQWNVGIVHTLYLGEEQACKGFALKAAVIRVLALLTTDCGPSSSDSVLDPFRLARYPCRGTVHLSHDCAHVSRAAMTSVAKDSPEQHPSCCTGANGSSPLGTGPHSEGIWEPSASVHVTVVPRGLYDWVPAPLTVRMRGLRAHQRVFGLAGVIDQAISDQLSLLGRENCR